ncbi:hypothetical protein CCC_03771 [Paramagnetospirillum magnetotacticum MS-1]|uniref:Uncharacterized protein n=1 Tax=Paramagnetospirillum magnetotacticum MS-1 TaxID=272627 RepID=A0A0C2YTL0_PARME|nr:hypothetical protein CCC_03771 [Paramagnetospirillum magnetotacticum MS-1]
MDHLLFHRRKMLACMMPSKHFGRNCNGSQLRQLRRHFYNPRITKLHMTGNLYGPTMNTSGTVKNIRGHQRQNITQ